MQLVIVNPQNHNHGAIHAPSFHPPLNATVGRFLPDKAIDLVDEACASVRVELDSQPEIMDKLERKMLQALTLTLFVPSSETELTLTLYFYQMN